MTCFIKMNASLAKSQRYELCSDKCRKAQALQNKREFDERARENNYDLLYKNECQNWRNKINRVKNTAGFPADRLEKIQVAFSDFKKEALQRKKAVKTGTASPKEFTDWLYQNTAGFPADRLEKIQVAFSDFKKEALQRKKAVKTGTASPKEFTDWLYQQSNVIVELTEY